MAVTFEGDRWVFRDGRGMKVENKDFDLLLTIVSGSFKNASSVTQNEMRVAFDKAAKKLVE